MNGGRFAVTRRSSGVVSLRIATDSDPFMELGWAEEFAGALAALGADAEVRTIVLEGGEQYFSAGASRSALLAAGTVDPTLHSVGDVAEALLLLSVPVIAAAAGHAIGGGLLVALWCDALVLADSSLYGANFMAVGITPGLGATCAVPDAFGGPLGRELLYSGRLITGREIRDAGCPLSHAVRPRAEVLEGALAMARDFAEIPREHLALLKKALAEDRYDRLSRALVRERS
ncbi:MAG TPA: enoyl-CoA hydratase-related protein, partial [Longimicrobiaceae bacterium]